MVFPQTPFPGLLGMGRTDPMGTRADFYVGRGDGAEWIGSIGWDGYPDNIDGLILRAGSEGAFRMAVADRISEDDGTAPDQGWPWPWNDSNTTDYSYAFDDGKVWATNFGYGWFDPLAGESSRRDDEKSAVFPDMSARQNIRWDRGSGLMVFGVSDQGTIGIVGGD